MVKGSRKNKANNPSHPSPLFSYAMSKSKYAISKKEYAIS